MDNSVIDVVMRSFDVPDLFVLKDCPIESVFSAPSVPGER